MTWSGKVKVRYLGCSNFAGLQLMKALAVSANTT
jgi:aryl-alcohol dehydrogenase-like predicted oxidoreductase